MTADATWSRRMVLVGGGAAAGALALAGPMGSMASAGVVGGSGGAAETGLRRDHWEAVVGRRVTVDGPGGRVRATVRAVEDLPRAAPGDPWCFSVVLRFAGGARQDGVFPVTIPGRGVATLLMTSVGGSDRHQTSQIIVNSPR